MSKFQIVSSFKPAGDQIDAITELTDGILSGKPHQVLLGVTGSGKTFTLANVIARVGRPTLVISHNKILAAQLYAEFKSFFPKNAVEYFISYYDYYQPEAYVPQSDTYIEKDASINEHIDRLRLKATSSLMEREDVIIVASVSCIYGLGSPSEYKELCVALEVGEMRPSKDILRDLVATHYKRNEVEFSPGTFRVRGDSIEIFPAYLDTALRVELFGDEIEKIREVHPLTGDVLSEKERVYIYPARHFVTTRPTIEKALGTIEQELNERLAYFRQKGKLLEAQRLEQRTRYDMEMLREMGFCHGIENYSRPLSGRNPGERPACLIDYFPKDFLTIVDESHVTLPQVRGMYEGDRARKQTLVDFGFRLPSALDNRPLKFHEFENLVPQLIYASATPAPYELQKAKGIFVEQVIRPTGLIDPDVLIRPNAGQIEDLMMRIKERVQKKERVLVTTLTKRMSEDLTDFLNEKKFRVRYMHSDIDALERIEIIQGLRKGDFDVLVGINLLREGLDLPEVSLVAVLDADKEGFLRSETTLIQVCGRAARNVGGGVVLYADKMTGSMARALDEMGRRRIKQLVYNKKHHITPRTIVKAVQELEEFQSRSKEEGLLKMVGDIAMPFGEAKNLPQFIRELETQMNAAADALDFELAAALRDKIKELRQMRVITKRGET
ncbi:MAG: excinuclease ABC subunit UvrB [Elusimicrobia bacterium]|nr:excinuclease ABC subunit UvrB [Candidatus Obscuribacterium magneticum]